MSDTSIEDKIIESASEEQQEILKKEKELHHNRVKEQHEDMVKRKEQTKKVQNVRLGVYDSDRIQRLKEENRQYLTLAKNSKVFMMDAFKAKVPYFAKNLITIGATTGSGKSTTCANLTFRAAMSGQNVLVITNEENVTDVYNRLTCLLKGWPYTDHTSFTDEQQDAFDIGIETWPHRVEVIDDKFTKGELGQTTTIEGIEGILNSILKNNIKYDVIILDYYQKVSSSTKNPKKEPWEVQAKLCKLLDSFKNAYTAPIIVLSQMKPGDDFYQNRIEGRKMIANVSTCVIELVADRDKLKTDWHIHKSRFIDATGETVFTGFKDGKYVPWTHDFQRDVDQKRQRRAIRQAKENNLGITGEKEGEEDDT